MDQVVPTIEATGTVAPPTSDKLTVADLHALIRKTNMEANSGGKMGPTKAPKVPVGAQGTAWLFVNRDMGLVAPVNKFDEVFPGIFLGDESFSRNKDLLKEIGITHMLNAAQGQKYNQIDTSENYYADLGLTFMGIKAMDIMTFKMTPHFQPAAQFIHEGLQSGGKVAVHCHMGRSRSASLILAYLMLHHSLSLVEALRTICLKRAVFPNDGFLRQLIKLDEELQLCTTKKDGHSPTCGDQSLASDKCHIGE